jgi:hypothetical protein
LPRTDVQLGCKADFEVADALGEAVLGELIRGSLQGFGVLKDGAGVGETVEVLGKVPIIIFEHQLPQASRRVRGKLDISLMGHLDERFQA